MQVIAIVTAMMDPVHILIKSVLMKLGLANKEGCMPASKYIGK
jgi:fumarate reductase subunit D